MRWTGRLARLGIVPLLVLLCTSTIAGTIHTFSFHAGSYPGSRDRQYKVYVPDDLTAPAPLVMALHGCRQNADDGLRNLNCWGFWFDGHRHEGRGEPEDLRRIAQAVETRFVVDPVRRYITGLSSGGAMAVVAATTHNEYWAAAVRAAPASHILAGRAVRGGWFGLRALATGDAADIGYVWDFWFAVTLYEGLPGHWYALAPAACRE
jgi:poly(3-hydroxybutyrate) depolymerase